MKYFIGEFSKRSGLSAHTLRYYEKLGILKPERDKSGRRIYSKKDLEWTAFLKRLKETGMPLKEIIRYSNLREQGDSTLKERMTLLETHRIRLQKNLKAMTENLDKLDEKIAHYQILLNTQDVQKD